METTIEVLVTLAERYSFAEVSALLRAGTGRDRLTSEQATRAEHLCAFGQRLLDLDAEDFADPTLARTVGVSKAMTRRARGSRMPQTPGEQPRGALDSLKPVYRLLLEVIAARWTRAETSAVVAALHMTSEYAPLLVWEPVLGHAGDPPRLASYIGEAASRFGVYNDGPCAHHNGDRSAANKVRRLGRDPRAWRTYLDRQHSTVAHALAVCAAECNTPCSMVTRLSDVDSQSLRRRCKLALAYADTPLVRLRHAAPVGHGFGVPSPEEIVDAWARSRSRLGPAALRDDGFPLPGLPSFFTELAGAPVTPDDLLADVRAALVHALSSSQPLSEGSASW